jgi:putative membrane protein
MIAVFVVCLIAGFNALLKNILIRLSIGCSIIALGPILLIVNTLALWITGVLPLGIKVDNFWAAFWGGLIISVVSFVMDLLVSDGL